MCPPAMCCSKSSPAVRSPLVWLRNDRGPLTSTTMRLTTMYRDCGLALDAFLALPITAQCITPERTGSIHPARPDGPGPKRKLAYWFTALEDLIGQVLPATGTARE